MPNGHGHLNMVSRHAVRAKNNLNVKVLVLVGAFFVIVKSLQTFV